MSSPEARLDRHLREALATERALITTLQAHLAQTPPGPYRRLLQRHLHETRVHATNLATRSNSTFSLTGTAISLAQTAIGQALSLAKAPLDLVRGGTDTRERLLKNAKDECATEALEIATYEAIEALATALGDEETATLARNHRDDEERMLQDLRALIPTLASDATTRPTLPIEDYDDLNAGQLTARLSDLSQEQLRAVLDYEQRHRNRRSVVERARQLTATPPWAEYDSDDTQAILDRLTPDLAGAVRDYESRHRRRVAILEAAQQALTR
jgi:ferritin-like metal-binding protein YciE